MTFVFFVILLIMLIINLQIVRDYFHPTVIFKAVWLISTFVLLFYQERWGVSLALDTVCIFLVGFIFFDLGYILFQLVFKKKRFNIVGNYDKTSFQLKDNRIYLLLIITVSISLYLLYDITKIMGGLSVFLSDIMSYRAIMYDGSGVANTQRFLFRILEVIGISAFIFFLRDSNKNTRRNQIYGTILTLTIGIQLVSSGRMRLLAILIQMAVVYLIFQQKNGKYLSFSSQQKYVKRVLLLLTSFVLFFYLYGKYIINKITEDPFNNIAIYISSALPAFDMTWQTNSKTSEYFGQVALSPIYNIVSKIFGIQFGSGELDILESRVRGLNGFTTNVYTFYHEQIIDFGVIFIPFAMFLIGFLISFIKRKSEMEQLVGFWSAIYALFFYALFMSFFKDYFFINSTFTYITITIYFLFFKTKLINSNKRISNSTSAILNR